MCLSGLDLWIPSQAQTLLLLQIFKGSLYFDRDICTNVLSLLFKMLLCKLAGSCCPFSSILQDAGLIRPISPQFLSAKFWGLHYKLLLLFSPVRYVVDFSVWERPSDTVPYWLFCLAFFVSLCLCNSSFPLASILNITGSLHPVFY